jgi:hypothetical protein
MGNRTRDLPACSAVPQPTVSPRTPQKCNADENVLDPSRGYAKTVVAICNRFHFLNSEHTKQLYGPG